MTGQIRYRPFNNVKTLFKHSCPNKHFDNASLAKLGFQETMDLHTWDDLAKTKTEQGKVTMQSFVFGCLVYLL